MQGAIMASGITTVAQVAPPIPVSFLNRMLSIPTPLNIHGTCANQFTMPAQGGNILRMRRPNRLPTQAAKAPLGITGINPPPVIPTVTDIDAELNLYGSYMLVQEQVVLTSQDPVLNWMTNQLGIQLREVEDELIRDMLLSSAGQINCVGGFNGDNPKLCGVKKSSLIDLEALA